MVLVLVRAQRVLLPVNGHLNPSCEWIPELSSEERLPLIKSQREIFSQNSQRRQEHKEHYLVRKHDTKVEVGKDPYCTSSGVTPQHCLVSTVTGISPGLGAYNHVWHPGNTAQAIRHGSRRVVATVTEQLQLRVGRAFWEVSAADITAGKTYFYVAMEKATLMPMNTPEMYSRGPK